MTCNRTYAWFDFWSVTKLYGLCNKAYFDFQSVVKLYGLRNKAYFDFQRDQTKFASRPPMSSDVIRV